MWSLIVLTLCYKTSVFTVDVLSTRIQCDAQNCATLLIADSGCRPTFSQFSHEDKLWRCSLANNMLLLFVKHLRLSGLFWTLVWTTSRWRTSEICYWRDESQADQVQPSSVQLHARQHGRCCRVQSTRTSPGCVLALPSTKPSRSAVANIVAESNPEISPVQHEYYMAYHAHDNLELYQITM